jgi:hypothetical protein
VLGDRLQFGLGSEEEVDEAAECRHVFGRTGFDRTGTRTRRPHSRARSSTTTCQASADRRRCQRVRCRNVAARFATRVTPLPRGRARGNRACGGQPRPARVALPRSRPRPRPGGGLGQAFASRRQMSASS